MTATQICNHEQLADAIRDSLMSMDGMDRSEWLETIEMAIDGELDGVVEYWTDFAEKIGYDEDYVRTLVSEIADSIKSSEEFDEISRIEALDREIDSWDDED